MQARNTTRLLVMAFAILAGSSARSQASTYSATVLGNNPVAYWRLDETTVGTVTDATGHGNNGTHQNFNAGLLNKPGALVGDANPATQFDGVTGSTTNPTAHILGSIAPTTFDNDWTIETWFNHQAQTDWGGLFSNNVSPQNSSAPLLTMNNNTNRFGINQAGVSAADISVDLGAGHFNKWLYGAITYTAATNLFDVYVYGNGAPQHVSGSAYWALNENSNSFFIGRHWDGSALQQNWNGLLDEMAVYDTALTQTQLANHYVIGSVPEPSTWVLLVCGAAAMLLPLRRRLASE